MGGVDVLLDLREFRRALSELELLSDASAARMSGQRHGTAPQTLDILLLGCAAMRRVPVVPVPISTTATSSSAARGGDAAVPIARLGVVGEVNGCLAGFAHMHDVVRRDPHLLQRLILAAVAVLRHAAELPDGVLDRVVLLLVRAYRTLEEFALWTVRFVPVYVAVVLPLLEAQLLSRVASDRHTSHAGGVRCRLTAPTRVLACSLCDELSAVLQDTMCDWNSRGGDPRFSVPLLVLAKSLPVEAEYAEARCKLLLLDRAARPHGVGTLVALGFPLPSVVNVDSDSARTADVVVRELDAASALYFAFRGEVQRGAEAFCAVRNRLPALFEIWSAHTSMTSVLESTIWELATSCACAFSSESRLMELLDTLLPPLLQFATSLVEGSTESADLLFMRLFEAVRMAVELRLDLFAFCQRTIPNLIGAVRVVRGTYVDVEFASGEPSSVRDSSQLATCESAGECSPRFPKTTSVRGQVLVALFEFLAVCLRSPNVEEEHQDTTAVLEALGFYSIVQFVRNIMDYFSEASDVGSHADLNEAAAKLFLAALCVGIEGAKQRMDLMYVFSEVLPRVFANVRLAGGCGGSLERQFEITERLLELGARCLRQGMHPTQSFANRIVDAIAVCGERGDIACDLQFALLQEALASVLCCVDKKLDVSVLVATGIPVLVQLLAHTLHPRMLDCFRDHVSSIARRFCGPSATTAAPLLTLDSAWTFLRCHLNASEHVSAANLVLRLAFLGRRDEIRALHAVCNSPLELEDFRTLRGEVFRHSQQFMATCHLTRTILDFRARGTAGKGSQWVADAVLASACDYIRRKNGLSAPVLRRLQQTMERGAFCCVVFPDELQKLAEMFALDGKPIEQVTVSSADAKPSTHLVADCLLAALDELFAPEVRSNDNLMEAVGLVGQRIHLLAREPARLPLVECATCGLRVLCERRADVTASSQEQVKSTGDECDKSVLAGCFGGGILWERVALMQDYFLGLERNRAVVAALQESGYSSWVWALQKNSDSDGVTVVLGDAEAIEASFRRAVLEECYEQYAVLLAKCGTNSILLSGESVAVRCSEVFDATLNLSIDELRSRRAQCARVIEAGRTLLPLERSSEVGREMAVLVSRESELERAMEDEISLLEHDLQEIVGTSAVRCWPAQKGRRTHLCRACVRKGLLDCVASCSGSVEGCYQSSGVHTEKPIEIGVRADTMIWSVVDVTSRQEIENVEVLLCREGAYVFRAYTSGHSLCTSAVWLHLFHELLASGHVMRIILPQDSPTRHLFRLLLDRVGCAVASTPLTFDFDFAEECSRVVHGGGAADATGEIQRVPYRSYYDSRPETIVAGKDVVLTADALERGFFAFPRVLEVGVMLSSYSTDASEREGERRTASSAADRRQARTEREVDAYFARGDWAGLLLARTLAAMRGDPLLRPFVVLGRGVAQYVSAFVDNGAALVHLNRMLEMEIDVERWNRSRSMQTRRGGGKRRKQAGEPAGGRVGAEEGPGPALTVEGKHEVVRQIVSTVWRVCEEYVTETDFARLLECNAAHFWAAREFLRRHVALAATKSFRCAEADYDEEVDADFEVGLELLRGRELLRRMDAVLRASLEFIYVHELPHVLQVAAMQAVFRNEDLVWRNRGGRPSHETVDMFVRFVRTSAEGGSGGDARERNSSSASGAVPGQLQRVTQSVGGVLVVNYRRLVALAASFTAETAGSSDAHVEALGRMLRGGEVLGYTVGEFVSENVADVQHGRRSAVGYEVVTAWVFPHLRRLGVASTMYRRLLAALLAFRLPSGRVLCCADRRREMPVARGVVRFVRVDVLRGAWGRVIAASWLGRLGLCGRCGAARSYSTRVGVEGRQVEAFERRDVQLYSGVACEVLLYAAGVWLLFAQQALREWLLARAKRMREQQGTSRRAAAHSAGKLKTL